MNKFETDQAASQNPPLTPLDRLLQVEMQGHLAQEVESGCLIPVPAQTGIGKTHAIKNKILEEVVEAAANPGRARTIYYITNSVDNVRKTYHEIVELIDEQQVSGKPRFTEEQKSALKNQVVYLPSQSHQLLNATNAQIGGVIHRFGLRSDSQVCRAWDSVKKLRQSIDDHPAFKAGFQESLEEKAADTYGMIINRIQARQRSEQPVILSASDHEDLDQLIPGERLHRKAARVCFMTTRKFLAGYQTIKSRVHPVRELHGALVFIDEFDRQNEIILKFMAEQKTMDLIELTRTLHANLQQHRLEKSSRYEGIEKAFEPLQKSLLEFRKRWSLQFSFNIDGASLENEKVRLFSDRTVTHAHSSQHILRLVTRENMQKNIIYSKKRMSEDSADDYHSRLGRFVNEADWLFRRFIWTMRSSVWVYLGNVAKFDHQNATLQDAVISILRHFNLQDLSRVVFAAFDAQATFTGQRKKHPGFESRMALRTYHDNGLKLTDVRRNEGALDTVSCYYTGFTVTPSGLLARLVESGAKIIGISATATSPTVIKNFDLDYLETRLGDDFVKLTHAQESRIGEYYRSRRRYSESGVRVEARFLGGDRNLLTQELERQSNRVVRKPAMLLNQWLGIDQDSEFSIGWVSRLLEALEQFMHSEPNRYMVVLLNRSVSMASHGEFITFLERFLKAREKETGRTSRLFSGMNAQSMRLGDFDSVLKHLGCTNDKVILLSTYASMGEGKNPDYRVELLQDMEQLIWVGDGLAPADVKTDIDTLYLEKPTHQLLSDPDDYQVNQLLLFHQIVALQEAGWLSPRAARSWVKQALQGTHHNRNLGRYYRTQDYSWVIRKVIEQAVGRTARTAFKRSCIKIFCDSDLRAVLATDTRPEESLSHEYVALVKGAVEQTDFLIENQDTLRQRNRASLVTLDTLALIRELMTGFQGASPEPAIRDWENLRKQLLTEPTRGAACGSYPRLYLQAPSTGGYRFSGSLETDQSRFGPDSDLHFFDQAKGNRWVSEIESGLPRMMKNPVVRKRFESRGYATFWEQQSWLMNPAAFFNLYKGALGEEGVEAILQHHGAVTESLPPETYEVCDFLVRTASGRKTIGVDAKHWKFDGTVTNHPTKIEKLERHLGVERFAYINLFGCGERKCRFLDHTLIASGRECSSVIEVPGLIDRETGVTLDANLMTLLEWIGGCQ